MIDHYIPYIFSYYKIRKVLMSYQYSPAECRSALQRIRQMDAAVFHAFLHWVATSTYPEGYLNNVSVSDLVKLRNLTPPAAFIVADWMGKDPSAAVRFITFGSKDSHTNMGYEDIPDDLAELVSQLESQAEQTDESPFETKPQS